MSAHTCFGAIFCGQPRKQARADCFACQSEECGRAYTTGPAHDPYGSSCDRPAGHRPPHEADDPFGRGRVQWTGGGTIAGDPVPVRNVRLVP